MWQVDFYKTSTGKIPLTEFMDSLPKKLKVKALSDIGLLEELGTDIRLPYSKHLKNGLFELRIQQSNNNVRIFYFFFIEKKIILTNGFIKKTQKIPSKEIERGLMYKEDYERRLKK